MKRFWDRFVERYANDPFIWYQPKGFTIKPSNLPIIRNKLRVLLQFDGKPWRGVQRRYTTALQRQGLFRPRAARKGSADYAVIVRMNKEVFDSLGLVWVGEESIIQVTPAGQAFLACPDRELAPFVARQLRRYMYPNPAVGRTCPEAGVLPYPALLAVLAHFPEGVPIVCYDLFISRIRTDDDVPWATEHIQAYMALTAAEALDHYRSRGEVAEAMRLFQDKRARRSLAQDPASIPEGEFRRLQVLERTLEDFLEFNLDLLEAGLELVGRQYPTPTGPLDILAQDSRRRWVVIELKRGRASDRTVGQLLRYMAFVVKERANGQARRVRGFAVAESPDQRLIQAAAGARAAIEVFEFKIKGKANRVYPA